jgi:hypothetical protein
MTKETLIYALAKGETERYTEDLMYAGGKLLTQEQVQMVIDAASKDGWHSFRVTTYDGSAPDFSKVLSK